jgi:hypothetical protein
MTWVNGHIRVFHPREPWAADERHILIQTSLDKIRGAEFTEQRADYEAAKLRFDMDAAERVLARTVSKDAMDTIVANTIIGGIGARIVMPHPPYDDDDAETVVSQTEIPTNALPFIYSGYLGKVLDCPVDEEIVEIGRVGRTKLKRWARYLYQPSFGGAVRPGQTYILADDVISTGGTFAALRSYIVRNGGRVLFATALAHGKGQHRVFAIEEQTVNQLSAMFGPGLDDFWTETFGHAIGCLTEAEGQYLRRWSNEQLEGESCQSGAQLLQRLRDRIDEAATTCG